MEAGFCFLRVGKSQAEMMITMSSPTPADRARSARWIVGDSGYAMSKSTASAKPLNFYELSRQCHKSRYADPGVVYSAFCLDLNVSHVMATDSWCDRIINKRYESAITFPLQTIRCKGLSFPCPCRPDRFLKVRYGSWQRRPKGKGKLFGVLRRIPSLRSVRRLLKSNPRVRGEQSS